jgi:cysteine desulfurase
MFYSLSLASVPNAVGSDMSHRPIYMDNQATTRVDPRVVEVMLPFFTERYGNPGSVTHAFGREAREAVETARQEIAAVIGVAEREVIFTSGATESNNLAIRGVADRSRRKGNHLVTVATEHRAALDPMEHLGRHGFDVTLLDVRPSGSVDAGRVDPEQVTAAIRDDTVLVSVMLANNEIGVIQDIAAIGAICRSRGVPFHCDATQGVGKLPIDLGAIEMDLMSFSAHKIYGPKAIGALVVRRRPGGVRLTPQILGGGQQRGLRSGTLWPAGIVGFAKAITLCRDELPTEAARLAGLRNRLMESLHATVPDLLLCGPALDAAGLRLPGNLMVSFTGVDAEALLLSMPELALSSGAACSSARPEPSHVLRALGMDDDQVRSSVRFGLGRFNTEDDVQWAVTTISRTVERLRKMGRASQVSLDDGWNS